MNKYGRKGLKIPVDFVNYGELMRVRCLALKYGVSIPTIVKWKRNCGLSNGVAGNRKITWVEKDNGCRECTSHMVNSGGYPAGNRKTGRRTIARYLYEEKYGKIKLGLVLRHKCDNRMCINIDHLEVGEQIDNVRDAVERGRNVFGERHGNAKLSLKKLEMGRGLRIKGLSYEKIADVLGVSESTLWLALNFKTWRVARGLSGEIRDERLSETYGYVYDDMNGGGDAPLDRVLARK
jgi:hypothetical protein